MVIPFGGITLHLLGKLLLLFKKVSIRQCSVPVGQPAAFTSPQSTVILCCFKLCSKNVQQKFSSNCSHSPFPAEITSPALSLFACCPTACPSPTTAAKSFLTISEPNPPRELRNARLGIYPSILHTMNANLLHRNCKARNCVHLPF